MRWTERLFDPEALAKGPPPQGVGPFSRWLLHGAWPAILLLGFVSLLVGLSEAVAAWLIGWLVDAAAAGPDAFFAANGLALAVVALFFAVLRPGLMIVSSALSSRSLQPGLFHLGVWRLQRHTLGQSLRFFEDDFSGRVAQKQMQTATALADSVTEAMNSIGFAVAAAIGAVVAMAVVDFWLGGVLFVWLAAYVGIVAYYLPRIRALSQARAEARAGVSGQLVDSLSHMATVKLFAHAGREEEAARLALQRFRGAALDFGRVVQRFRAWLAVLAGILPVALVGGALYLWAMDLTTVGTIAVAGFLALRIGQMSGWISFTAMGLFANVGVVEDGMRTLAKPHDIVDAADASDQPRRVQGRIRFERVVFRYGRELGGGLDGLELSIAPGEKVALVGRSGAGKSTTVALLSRLYDVEGGRITIDGIDVRAFAQDHLRRQIATVTQETAMFNRSALDNILYGRPEAGREAAIRAAVEAAADPFIRDLKDHRGRTGYDAFLGERGVKLSGGQRQRIALARAILKDAPILVLDEATSALDSETEAAVQAALDRLMQGRTVVAIAHRLSTIARMDRIVVLDQGRVVEAGSHQALLAKDGIYADLWAHQSGGFIGLEEAAE
ncbi:MAG: ABC transporter ATP-binding protein [Geminicoccaceae bacterium]|nr:MAG: ABC transporter ATP-binding protein [Geminicoccaceae bacterium]